MGEPASDGPSDAPRPGGPGRRLTLADIDDLRAYERVRPEYRERIVELKRRRRVSVGPLVTLVFENRDTIRFQIQEMARVEKMATDEQIQGELDVYNPSYLRRGSCRRRCSWSSRVKMHCASG